MCAVVQSLPSTWIILVLDATTLMDLRVDVEGIVERVWGWEWGWCIVAASKGLRELSHPAGHFSPLPLYVCVHRHWTENRRYVCISIYLGAGCLFASWKSALGAIDASHTWNTLG